jgi:DNA-binding CsgD family transcriptional regulator
MIKAGMGELEKTILPQNWLLHELSLAENMPDGLQILKSNLKSQGVRDIVYTFMLYEKSYVRGDYMLHGTFPPEIRQLYEQSGGGAAFRFGEILAQISAPLFFDIKALLDIKSPMHSYNSCAPHIYERGYHTAWIIPFSKEDIGGYGFLMLFQDSRSGAPVMDIKQLAKYAPLYHKSMKQHKQMAGYYGLTQKQCEALAGMAKGQTAGDIADHLGLTERSVELRLQEARKKLRARTTTEAAYKALAYGILPNCVVDK